MIKSILFLFSLLASLLYYTPGQNIPTAVLEKGKKPNIVLIMADDMGYECLSSYGSAVYNTPNLDKLAAQGVRFTHCYSQPLCTPSRVQIMTGKYNFRNYEAFGYLNPKEKTFGNLLKDAGYATCIAGKWQLSGISGPEKQPGWDDTGRPNHFGFDEYCLWQLRDGRAKGERYADPLIVQNGKNLSRNGDAYGPDIFTDFILDFIEKKKDEPFFVYYPMALVHDPFVPTPASKEWSQATDRYKDDTRHFKEMVTYSDKLVGKILDKLRQTRLDENTLVIFTGDNGTNVQITSLMQDGTRVAGEKGSMTDGGTRVPLIAYWAGKSAQGKVNQDLIDFTDFLPTLADAASVKVPGEPDGRSFLPQVLGKKGNPKPYVYMYYQPRWGKFADGVFARNHTYKLYSDGRLFNVEKDVREQQPLDTDALSASEKAVHKQLQAALSRMPDLR
ncbi:MAG: sulfatase-like hydrolase/transferase [Bacteroidetes bacterium]|nr:sulfatase-like hydrolase/transferase [Bacteroidota bacterium]